MSAYKQHLDLANERFSWAQRALDEEEHHLAAHLFINAAINYHTAVCQKFLNKIPRHKQHSDTSYFNELAPHLGEELPKYREAYEFLMKYKSEADYGTEMSLNITKQISRRAGIIREIAEAIL